MTEYISVPLLVALSIAVTCTTLFSFANKPGIRGFRNLGILASYVLGFVFIFVSGWLAALLTWLAFGLAGGVAYLLWEVLQRLRTPPGEEKSEIRLSSLFFGLLFWPIMFPEAVEYTLAELGILKISPPAATEESPADSTATEGEETQ